jgi:hypothetical protein
MFRDRAQSLRVQNRLGLDPNQARDCFGLARYNNFVFPTGLGLARLDLEAGEVQVLALHYRGWQNSFMCSVLATLFDLRAIHRLQLCHAKYQCTTVQGFYNLMLLSSKC